MLPPPLEGVVNMTHDILSTVHNYHMILLILLVSEIASNIVDTHSGYDG